MTKKRLILYGLLLGIALALLAGVYVYQEYLGEDTPIDPNPRTNPVVEEKLRAVVTQKTVSKMGNTQKVVLDYTDLDSHKSASLTINAYAGQAVQLGDTLMKDKGEKMILVYRPDGSVNTIPID